MALDLDFVDGVEVVASYAPPPSLPMIEDARLGMLEVGGRATVDTDLSCPICLGPLREPMATECLHRFCFQCIQTALRLGGPEKRCPTCRLKIATRRALRRDDNFEQLVTTLIPVETRVEQPEPMLDVRLYQHRPLRPANGDASDSPLTVTIPPRAPPRLAKRSSDCTASPSARSPGLRSAARRHHPPGFPPASSGLDESGTQWECGTCTLLNNLEAKKRRAAMGWRASPASSQR